MAESTVYHRAAAALLIVVIFLLLQFYYVGVHDHFIILIKKAKSLLTRPV